MPDPALDPFFAKFKLNPEMRSLFEEMFDIIYLNFFIIIIYTLSVRPEFICSCNPWYITLFNFSFRILPTIITLTYLTLLWNNYLNNHKIPTYEV